MHRSELFWLEATTITFRNEEHSMKKTATCILMMFCLVWMSGASAAWAKHGPGHPQKPNHWEYKGVNSVEAFADIKHYKWELAVPPYGPMDKIALHRMVAEPHNDKMAPEQPAPDKRKVIFIIPGTWSVGYSPSSNPDESIALFLALNGYDVYGMDFRTSYVPNRAYHQFEPLGIDIAPTGEWTYGLFREDIKACVEKTKQISRARKIFLGGISRGVTQMWIYASKYLDDVKGLIGMDGGGIKSAPTATTKILADMTPEEIEAATQAYESALETFQATGVLLTEISGYEQGQFGAMVPYSEKPVGFDTFDAAVAAYKATFPYPLPDPPAPVTSAIELSAYNYFWSWGQGIVSNVYTPYPGGNGETYMNPETMNAARANNTRYWPNVQNMETSATFGGGGMSAYDDCPFLDYDDHWQEIDVPVLSLNGELTCRGGCANTSIEYTLNNLATDDTTLIHLPGYGHLDVYYGTHSREDMKEPLLEWLNENR